MYHLFFITEVKPQKSYLFLFYEVQIASQEYKFILSANGRVLLPLQCPLRGLRKGWKDNINMDLTEIDCEGEE
jgi:hypothetical protein